MHRHPDGPVSTVRRYIVSAALSPMLAVIWPLRAFAATGPAPELPPGDSSFDPSTILKLAAVAGVVVAVALVAVLRPTWRRRMAVVGILVGSSLVAFAMVVAGLFSDFSGQHRTYPVLVVAGIAVLIVGLAIAARVAAIARRSAAHDGSNVGGNR